MSKKDKLKVYVSFSKECSFLTKSKLVDAINNFHDSVEASAYWGGTYDRQELMDDADLVLVVSWDCVGTNTPSIYASRGIYEESGYATKKQIPTYCLVEYELGHHKGGEICDHIHVKQPQSYAIYNDETWDGDYGKINLYPSVDSFGFILFDALEARGLLNKSDLKPLSLTGNQPMLAAAKSLNLI